MNRTPAGPVHTPHTARHLFNTFANPWSTMLPCEEVDLSSQSPDSMYSDESPRCPDTNAFEDDELMLDHLEIDTTEYQTLTGEEYGGQEEGDMSSPAWGRWPNQSTLGGPGWTPMPTYSSFRSGSIISISPRGSLSTSRRGSLPIRKLSDTSPRRSSLGVPTNDLSEHDLVNGRRRSSAKSQISSRRRSSVMSNGTVLDPVEEERMRRLAGIGILARRFSELVEVVAPSPGDDEGMNDITYAREVISRWSPYSTETDISEIQTAPYVPTPHLAPHLAPPVPTIWSNYPLSSSVLPARETSLNTPEMEDHPVSPVFALRVPRFPIEYTPPPPREPTEQLRQRSRPGIVRASTNYVFPPSPTVDLLEIPFRPIPRRAVSTPQLPFVLPADLGLSEPFTIASSAISRPCLPPTGSFPLARSHPLGLSRLRESTGRTSVSGDVPASPGRPSIVAGRRISIVQQGSRRASMTRKLSRDVSPKSSRKPSLQSLGSDTLPLPRRVSVGSDLRRESLDPSRRASSTSRKSSTISLGEYTYLASEIDPSLPVDPTVEPRTSQTLMTKTNSLSSRRNAPPSIIWPAYQFPSSPSALLSGSSSATPRYSPLDSFFGRTPSLTSSGSGSAIIDPLSPCSNFLSPRAPGLHRGVIDRGRPISSPEFHDGFPFRSAYPGPHTKSTRGERNLSDITSVQDLEPRRPKSPSYRFPVTPPRSDLRSDRKVKLAALPVPLKSILVHRTGDFRVNPPARPQAQRASTFESDKDIQLLLRARHESMPPVHSPALEIVEGKKARPTIKHQSSFTRLFQRAKGHSDTSST